jgi:pyrroloquinoline-quinone synthase
VQNNADFWNKLEEIRANNNVLEHSFYQRWSAGELTQEELGYYAGEYDQAVRGLAEAVASTREASTDEKVRADLAHHVAEEESHIPLWEAFAGAIGTPVSALDSADRAESSECRSVWAGAGEKSFMEGLVTLYAVESGQPEISKTKLEGLREFYGYSDGPATEYFELHAELDVEHAEHSRKLIEANLVDADVDKLLQAAEDAFAANWKLLDGVEKHFGRPASERMVNC